MDQIAAGYRGVVPAGARCGGGLHGPLADRYHDVAPQVNFSALYSSPTLLKQTLENDSPRLLGNSAACEERREQLGEPHIAPLTALVRDLRSERGPDVWIPDFDPWDGGVNAEILFLLEAPGGRAVSSGFISRNNPDSTAKNFFELNREAGISRHRTVTWNVVPWYIGTGKKIRGAKQSDVAEGVDALRRLLSLLPRLKAVVLLGRPAERSAELIRSLKPDVGIFISPHPSPLFVNNKPGNRDRILAVLHAVAVYLDDGHPAV